MRALVMILWAALLGCNGPASPGVQIQLIDPAGDNAAFGIVEGTLSVDVRQGDQLLCAEGCGAEIRGGDFDLTLPIQSVVDLTTIQGHIRGTDVVSTDGAVPRFAVAGEGLGTGELPVRLVMMPPDSCALLEVSNVSTMGRPRLVEPRRDAAAAVRRNNILLAGGLGRSGGSSRIDFFDPVVVEMRPPLGSPPGALGRTVGLALSEDDSLFVGETSWIYVSQMGPPGATPVDLHGGADGSSALVMVANTAAVIGGTGTREITWMLPSGVVVPGSEPLLVERSGAVAASGSRDGALVVGGAAGGEWVSPSSPSVAVDGLPDASGGWLAVSPSGQTYLWIGATDTETWSIRGCPGACAAAPDGPLWERARDGASGVQTEAGKLWIVGGDGSDAIDIVRWDGETPSIGRGPSLSSGVRAGASVVEHASGVVLVIGGQRAADFLDDVEICSPAELDAL